MNKFYKLYFLLFTLFSLRPEAREEIVLTIPKSGTYYLKSIIENITSNCVIPPSIPDSYKKIYNQIKSTKNGVVIGHCEPLILDDLPNKTKTLLLIRDPRDVALSAVDFIDNKGLFVWPGLEDVINKESWIKLTKKDKLLMILDQSYDYRGSSIVSFFETAIKLTSQKECLIIKYEQLSPEHNNFENLSQTITNIGMFFKVESLDINVKNIIKKSFKNKSCETLNKGQALRFLEEDISIIELLNEKLKKYIEYFNYDLDPYSSEK